MILATAVVHLVSRCLRRVAACGRFREVGYDDGSRPEDKNLTQASSDFATVAIRWIIFRYHTYNWIPHNAATSLTPYTLLGRKRSSVPRSGKRVPRNAKTRILDSDQFPDINIPDVLTWK